MCLMSRPFNIIQFKRGGILSPRPMVHFTDQRQDYRVIRCSFYQWLSIRNIVDLLRSKLDHFDDLFNPISAAF